MTERARLVTSALLVVIAGGPLASRTAARQAPSATQLAQPVFHHLHLNSMNPSAAIAG